MKSFIFALPMILACASLTVWAAPPGKDIDVYHIGNSLTRGLSVRRLAALFDAAGGHYDHGTQLGGGKALYEHLANRTASGKPFKRNNIQSARGWNCYVPIPYQKSCKIVADPDWGQYAQFTCTRFPEEMEIPAFIGAGQPQPCEHKPGKARTPRRPGRPENR